MNTIWDKNRDNTFPPQQLPPGEPVCDVGTPQEAAEVVLCCRPRAVRHVRVGGRCGPKPSTPWWTLQNEESEWTTDHGENQQKKQLIVFEETRTKVIPPKSGKGIFGVHKKIYQNFVIFRTKYKKNNPPPPPTLDNAVGEGGGFFSSWGWGKRTGKRRRGQEHNLVE